MKELVEEFERLKEQLALADINIAKFVSNGKGSKAASVRARKNMLEIRNMAQNIRIIISKIKNEGTYKTE